MRVNIFHHAYNRKAGICRVVGISYTLNNLFVIKNCTGRINRINRRCNVILAVFSIVDVNKVRREVSGYHKRTESCYFIFLIVIGKLCNLGVKHIDELYESKLEIRLYKKRIAGIAKCEGRKRSIQLIIFQVLVYKRMRSGNALCNVSVACHVLINHAVLCGSDKTLHSSINFFIKSGKILLIYLKSFQSLVNFVYESLQAFTASIRSRAVLIESQLIVRVVSVNKLFRERILINNLAKCLKCCFYV